MSTRADIIDLLDNATEEMLEKILAAAEEIVRSGKGDMSRAGNRSEPGLLLHRLEYGIPVPSFQKLVMEIGMLKAHPCPGRHLVDAAGDCPRYPGQAFLAEGNPLSPDRSAIRVGLQGLDKGSPGKRMAVFLIEKPDAKVTEAA